MERREVPNPNYPQELKQLGRDAMLLLHLRCTEIDPETAIQLEIMKRKFLPGRAKITEYAYEDDLEMWKGKNPKFGGVIRNGEDSVGNYGKFSEGYDDQNRKFEIPECSKAEYELDHGKLKGKNHKIDVAENNYDQSQVRYYAECSNTRQDQNKVTLESPKTEHDQNHPFPAHPIAVSKPWLIEKYSKPVAKTLTASDVSITLQRLQFSKKDAPIVFSELLLPKEKQNLADGIRVEVYGNKCATGYPMVYKYWKTSPVLAKGWKDFYVGEELEVGDHVTIWMFRDSVKKQLGFLFSSKKP